MGNCAAKRGMWGGVQVPVGRQVSHSQMELFQLTPSSVQNRFIQRQAITAEMCVSVRLRGRSRSGALQACCFCSRYWSSGVHETLLQCDYVCWQVQDRTMHAFGTLTTVKTE